MSTNMLARIADRALNRPLLITPEKAQVILSVLGGRIGVERPMADRFEGDRYKRDADADVVVDDDGYKMREWKFKTVDDRTAVISIVGSLVNRGAWIGTSSGLVSYEGIKSQLKAVMAAPNIDSVILDIDSPGGEAIGAFEVADMVRSLRETKTVVAIANGMACSAAYAIASGASRVVTTPSGVTGSIGVVLLHADFSQHLAQEGITPTLIFAGDRKVDGNPFEPLPNDVAARLSAEVDAFYDLFLTNVAAGRGDRLSADAARATQAQTFMGEQAVANGLADSIGTFESVRDQLSRARAGRSTSQPRRPLMSENTGAPAAEPNAGLSTEDHQAALTAARQDGAQAASERLTTILSAEGIAGDAERMAAALELATESPDMAADAVVRFASKVNGQPAEQATSSPASLENRAADPLGAAMGANGHGDKPKSGLTRLIDRQLD